MSINQFDNSDDENNNDENNNLRFEDFELSEKLDIDCIDLIDILKESESISQLKKQYIHSLFTPLLYFIIDLLNSKKHNDKFMIGMAEIHKTKIAYITLNKKIYNLFFQKKKETIYETELNFEGKREEENYTRNSKLVKYLEKEKIEKKKIKNELTEYIKKENKNEENIIIFEGDLNQEDILKKFCIANKKEIISLFRYGYVVQERFINILLEKVQNNVTQLPNLIFYQKKNNENKDFYREVDRILLAKNDIEISQFSVYYKAEFIQKEKEYELIENEYINGENLKLSQKSINFIEIKNSIEGIFKRKYNKKKDDDDDIFFNYSISENSKKTKNGELRNNSSYISAKEFLSLYKELSLDYKSINIIFIFDSSYKKDFISISKIITHNFIVNKIDFSFNLYFVHVEPDTPYIYEISVNSKIDELNNLMKIKDEEVLKAGSEISKLKEDSEKLKIDSEKKMEKLKIDSEKKMEKLKKDSEKKIENLTQEISQLKDNYKMMYHQNKLRTTKKKARKENFIEIINEGFKTKVNLLPKQKLLIGHTYNESYTTLENIPENLEQYAIIIDTKSFCRLFKRDIELEEDVINKHLTKLTKYNSYKNQLILIVDYAFMKSFNQIKKKFNINNCQISLVNGKNGIFFKTEISKNELNQEIIFNVKIPGIIKDKIDFKEIKDIENFILYLIDLEELKNKNEFFNYPIYNPFTDGINYYFTKISKGSPKNEDNYLYHFDLFNANVKYDDFKPNANYYLCYASENFGDIKLIEKLIFAYFINEKNYNKIETYMNYLEPENFPIIYGNKENTDTDFLIYDDCDNKKRILVSRKSEKIILKIRYKTIFKSQSKSNIIIKKTKLNDTKIENTLLALNSNDIIDEKIIYYISSLFLSISSKEVNSLQISLNEDLFNHLEIYLKNLFGEKVEIISVSPNVNEKDIVDENIKEYLGNNKHIINANITNENNKYDCIFLKSYLLPDEKNCISPKEEYFEYSKLKEVNNNLKSNGIFSFNLIGRNKFLFPKIISKLQKTFESVISIKFSEVDQFIICFKTNYKINESIETLVERFSNIKRDKNISFINAINNMLA